MGLSASQARLLSLTARQSNLEYEGQQINQQRTSLSNESSNYYNSLLEMSVPVPPSTNDYTKVVYTFTIGGNEATVKEALPKTDDDGNTTYLVSFTTKLSTIGIQENDAYKTAASAKNAKGVKSVFAPIDDKDTSNLIYNEDDYPTFGQYYLATMNRVGGPDEAKEMKKKLGDDYKVYVQSDAASDTAIYIGPDGYEMSKETYKRILQEEDPDFKKKCKFYELETSSTPADKTRYALSYALISNQATFDAHKMDDNGYAKDRIYRIKEETDNVYETDPDGNPVQATDENGNPVTDEDGNPVYNLKTEKGLYSYKASNQSNFTVVDPQYEESFINAGLNINDYYQYEATSGVRFVKREDVEGNLNTESITIATSAVATINKVNEGTLSNTRIEFDKQGRISTITDEEGITYTMTATTETDNAAYDDAYNQYEYNQYVYDQRQNEINANIEILQAQDKSLELRLSSLDTQHSAIQTELEAVKKVMSKNIDNSFKTFSA